MWDRIAEFLFEVGQLERTPRSGYALLRQVDQTVAAHSFRVALGALALAKSEPDVDLAKLLAMSLIHDLPESRTSDLHHLAQRYVDVDESRALADQLSGLPFGDDLGALHREYREGVTLESRLVKDADQIELLLSLRERESSGPRDGDAWIPRLLDRLRTEGARELAASILRGDPAAWWKGGEEDRC